MSKGLMQYSCQIWLLVLLIEVGVIRGMQNQGKRMNRLDNIGSLVKPRNRRQWGTSGMGDEYYGDRYGSSPLSISMFGGNSGSPFVVAGDGGLGLANVAEAAQRNTLPVNAKLIRQKLRAARRLTNGDYKLLATVKIGDACTDHRQCPPGGVCHNGISNAMHFKYCVCAEGRPRRDPSHMQYCPDGVKREEEERERIERIREARRRIAESSHHVTTLSPNVEDDYDEFEEPTTEPPETTPLSLGQMMLVARENRLPEISKYVWHVTTTTHRPHPHPVDPVFVDELDLESLAFKRKSMPPPPPVISNPDNFILHRDNWRNRDNMWRLNMNHLIENFEQSGVERQLQRQRQLESQRQEQLEKQRALALAKSMLLRVLAKRLMHPMQGEEIIESATISSTTTTTTTTMPPSTTTVRTLRHLLIEFQQMLPHRRFIGRL